MVNHSTLYRSIKYDYMNILTWTMLKKKQIIHGCETFAYKYILLTFQGGTSFVDLFLFCFFCLVFAMPLCASVLCALWSPAGKGLTSWFSFVVSNC